MKRFTNTNPCPVCGGWDSLPRGSQQRCWGFLSKQGDYVHCTREEYAGGLRKTAGSDTYAHLLRGVCHCGLPHQQSSQKRKITAKYRYTDTDGKELFQVVRYEPKQFRHRRLDADGNWIWNSQQIRKPLYRLHELRDADENQPVWVAEGEKDADNLAKLGLLATTNPGGAGKWTDEHSETLRGRCVVVLPDNDVPGQAHAINVATRLDGIAKRVKVLNLPDLANGEDVSDWLMRGGTRRKLRKLALAAKPFKAADAADLPVILPFRTASDPGDSEPVQTDWIVDGLVAAGGITDVIGKVKLSGKTTFLTHMASRVVLGKPFMGRDTQKTGVLYLTEQPRASFLAVMKRAGLSRCNDFTYLHWNEIGNHQWGKIAHSCIAECKRRHAGLLIVDTIAPFAGLSGATENDSGHALEAMKPLLAATQDRIGVVIVQHERKGGGDIGDSGRGSTAFAGAADILLHLTGRKGRSQHCLREIHARSRFDETPPSLLIELTDDGYVSHGRVRPIAAQKAKTEILQVLKEQEGMTLDEICSATRLPRTTLQRGLRILLRKKRVHESGSGTKNAPYRYSLPNTKAANRTLGNSHQHGKEPGRKKIATKTESDRERMD